MGAPRIVDVTAGLGSTDGHAALQLAARSLLRGELVVLPTDTVYGVAVHPDTPDGEARLYSAKGRPEDKPIPLLLADAAAVTRYCGSLGPAAAALTERFWPGPLTLVLPTPVPGDPSRTTGFRVPDHGFTRALLAACGGALAVTSANRSGEPPALTAGAAAGALGSAVTLVLDDGPAAGMTPSTVVGLDADGRPRVLREGVLPAETISRAAALPAELN